MQDFIFVVRQSPDWSALADDYEAGREIDIRRFKPAKAIPGFPRAIERLIDAWNRLFDLNFFRCRQILKDVAIESFRQVPGATLLTEADYAAAGDRLAHTHALLFYVDDDDWFAPDLPARIADLDLDQADIAVFPLVRLDSETFTFVRRGSPATAVVGSRRDFNYRFQTNNYGVRTDRVAPKHVPQLKDHVEGSAYADKIGLTDAYFDRIISATNKTPCSAGGLPLVLQNPDETAILIRRYSERLRALEVPETATWIKPPLNKTIALFEQLVQSARPSPRFGTMERLRLKLKR